MKKLVITLIALLLCGCAGPWEKYYKPTPRFKGQSFAATNDAQIRMLETERLEAFEKQEHERMANSSVAVVDLPPEEKAAIRARFFETLQLPERDESVKFIGWSEFTMFGVLDPNDGKLASFAERKGANCVVVCVKSLGKNDEVITTPMTTYSSASVSNGYGRSLYGSGTSTTYVPTHVQADQYLYKAFFIRRTTIDP